MTITSSVTLSGASAESKGLEFAEHAPVRFVRIYANPPSGPLGFARGDSFRCHVERRGLGPEVETSRLDGASTIATRTGSRPSDRRDSSTTPAASLGMTALCHLERSDSGVERSRPIGAFTLTTHPRSAQPAKDERLSAVLRPGWLRTAGAKRRFDQLKPSEKPE